MKVGYVRNLALAVGLSLLLLPGLSSAEETAPTQASSGLMVQPAIFELVLEPGQPRETTIYVTNTTTKPLPVSTKVRGMVPQDELNEGQQAIYDASAWFQVTDPDYILQAGQTRAVKFILLPPKDAEPGGHYATIFFEPLVPLEQYSPNTAHLTARLGSIALLRIPGDATISAHIIQPLSTAAWRQFGPVDFQFKLSNDGNIHFLPQGAVVIRNSKGNVIKRLPLEPGVILPKTAKTYHVRWDQRLIIGKYTATIELEYGPDKIKLTDTPVTFQVVPGITFAIALILGIAFVITGILTRERWSGAIAILLGREVIYEDAGQEKKEKI